MLIEMTKNIHIGRWPRSDVHCMQTFLEHAHQSPGVYRQLWSATAVARPWTRQPHILTVTEHRRCGSSMPQQMSQTNIHYSCIILVASTLLAVFDGYVLASSRRAMRRSQCLPECRSGALERPQRFIPPATQQKPVCPNEVMVRARQIALQAVDEVQAHRAAVPLARSKTPISQHPFRFVLRNIDIP